MSWQYSFEHINGPFLKVFMRCDVDSTTKCEMSGVPCFLPRELLLINENPEHLKNRDSRVHLVEKNLIFFMELAHHVLNIL